ncbi:Ig-like domain-containing protein, partial [Verminephrobacter aporrectodeae]|uniref:Ig-like domain-containing protein n=1 Tax=Verminephrobacter aporrectodeae TaxID=1110389 RepID=UPI00023781A6
NNLSGVKNAANNAAVGIHVTSDNYSVDTVAPELTGITLADSALKIGETTTLTVTFSEVVSGLTAAHLTTPSGTLGALTRSADGLSWTGTLTPAADTTAASNAIRVNNLSGVTDAVGNLATGSGVTSANYSVDTVAPQLTHITLGDNALKAGETTSVTISFNEAVTGFGKDHLSVSSGTLGALTRSADGLTWTGTLTPAANTTAAANTIRVNNLSGVTDAAGNLATGSDVTSTNYRVDTVVPQLQRITLDDSALKIGATTTVTVTFSEVVDGLVAAHLT